MQERIINYKSQKEFRIYVTCTFNDLNTYHAKGEINAFNRLLLKILPQVKRYITDRLNTVMIKGKFSERKYSVEYFLDQLLVESYNYFDEVKDKEDLYPWLFKNINVLLEDTSIDEEFNVCFFENIDVFEKPEWDEMQDEFSTNGNGDGVMLEEQEDILYHRNHCVLNHVFVEDDKKGIMYQLDKDLGKENIRNHTDMVLYHLPLPMRTVFELATKYEFTLEEIAMIRDQSFEQVRHLLENARKSLEASLYNRYALSE